MRRRAGVDFRAHFRRSDFESVAIGSYREVGSDWISATGPAAGRTFFVVVRSETREQTDRVLKRRSDSGFGAESANSGDAVC